MCICQNMQFVGRMVSSIQLGNQPYSYVYMYMYLIIVQNEPLCDSFLVDTYLYTVGAGF